MAPEIFKGSTTTKSMDTLHTLSLELDVVATKLHILQAQVSSITRDFFLECSFVVFLLSLLLLLLCWLLGAYIWRVINSMDTI